MEQAIDAIRSFNRFFTRHVGAIDARFLDTDSTLPEARLLFEIATREPVLATTLQQVLALDRGYLSRMIARFEERRWIVRDRGASDARARPIRLTPEGRAAFDLIDDRQRSAVAADLTRLDPIAQADLVRALATARLLLDPDAGTGFTIRTFRTGDIGLIAARQSLLYANSHGWGRALEILEGEVTTRFLRDFKPGREQCWVAEIDHVMAGAVFLTDEGAGMARLRLLYVEPFARKCGIGDALVRRCIDFARDAGYAEITLWTHDVLEAARRLYARNGFTCIASAVHHVFEEPLTGETWQLRLTGDAQSPA